MKSRMMKSMRQKEHRQAASRLLSTRMMIAWALALLFPGMRCLAQSDGPGLKLPEIPAGLREPSPRAAWLLEHFFDNWKWASPVTQADTLQTEQLLADFFSIMPVTDSIGASPGAIRLMESVSKEEGLPEMVARLSHVYLNEPQSPCFFEEGYLVMADAILRHPADISEGELDRTRFRKAELMKNRVGERATDFRYLDINGEMQTLAGTSPAAGERLLVFYDQECRDCIEELRRLSRDPQTGARVADGTLTVTIIEAFGADADQWRRMASTFPDAWQKGRSPEGEVEEEEIYVMRRNPTKYLLDAEGRILKKDF